MGYSDTVGRYRRRTSDSLVLTRGASVVTQFFSRVKLKVTPVFSPPLYAGIPEPMFGLSFHVVNNGKDTAANLRAESFTGRYLPVEVLPYDEKLKWSIEDVEETPSEVTLPYRGEADALWPRGFYMRSSNEETEYFFDENESLGRFPIGTKTRVCDVTVYVYGAGGVEKIENLWLIVTRKGELGFEKRSWRYR